MTDIDPARSGGPVNKSTWRRAATVVVCVGLVASEGSGFAQPPAAPAAARPVLAQVHPAGGGGIAALSAHQMAALAKMTTDLPPLIQAAVRARDELVPATFALPRNDAAIPARTDAIRGADTAPAHPRRNRLRAL